MATKLRLEGKIAIITGGASGIGEAAARLFVEHGAYVIIADIQDELGLQVMSSIGTEKVCYRHCDVTNEKQVEETVAFAVEKYGTLDIMYSNAGTLGTFGSILDMDVPEFDKTIAVNTQGTTLAVKHAARIMVAENIRGSIVCTASVESILAGAAPIAYITLKHCILGLMKAAKRELGKNRIRLNYVSPYGIATSMLCKSFGAEAAHIEASVGGNANLKGVVLTTKHIAEAALFLMSDESAYISGQNLAVDGASDIGETAARLFLEHGANVIIADIQDELGLQVTSSIGTEKVCYRHCDVTDEKQVEETVASLSKNTVPSTSCTATRAPSAPSEAFSI